MSSMDRNKMLETHVKRAEGFLEIGLYHDAWEELETLQPPVRAHPDALFVRLQILIAMERWEDAAALGAGCCRICPNHEGFFMWTADALMRMGDYGKSLLLLRGAPGSLRARPEYHYTLARSAARVGLVVEAKQALRECFNRDRSYRQRGLDDPDLESVWWSL